MTKINLTEVLERLAQANDSEQFKQKLAGLYTANREYPETIQKLHLIEEIWIIGKKRR